MAPKPSENAEGVSLEGLDPEAALRALMAVDPDAPPVDDDQDEPEASPRATSSAPRRAQRND